MLQKDNYIVSFAEYAITNYKGELVYLQNPTEPLHLDKAEVTDQEKSFHADYFSGEFTSRTPEAYLKIRNHILCSW